MADKKDIDTWRALRNSMRDGLASRGIKPTDRDIDLVTRFVLEEVEQRHFRIVPLKQTREMHVAVQEALYKGKRQSVRWVIPRIKNQWRYISALDAAPSWRRGYEADQQSDEQAAGVPVDVSPAPNKPGGTDSTNLE